MLFDLTASAKALLKDGAGVFRNSKKPRSQQAWTVSRKMRQGGLFRIHIPQQAQ